MQPVGRRQRLDVELDRRIGDARGRVREGLELAVVRRRDRQRADLEQMRKDRLRQRRALDGVRARPQLVEQHQGLARRAL